jgi:hypothetical protein
MTNVQSSGFHAFYFILQRGDGSCKAEGNPGGGRTEDAPRGAEKGPGRRTKKVELPYKLITVLL